MIREDRRKHWYQSRTGNKFHDWAHGCTTWWFRPNLSQSRASLGDNTSSRTRWVGLWETLILLLGSLMPLLQNWLLLIPPLTAYARWRLPAEVYRPEQNLSSFSRGVMGAGVLGCVALALGYGSGIHTLLQDLGWIVLTWLVSRSFSSEFSRRFLSLFTLSAISWMGLGFAQMWSDRPVPLGWLEANQVGTITFRLVSVFGNPNVYALYLVVLLVLAGFVGTTDSRPGVKAVYGTVWLLGLVSLYFTYSRTAWLLAAAWMLCQGWRRFRWRGIELGGLTILASYLYMPGLQLRMLNLVTLNSSSLWYRIRIWCGTWRALHHFWLWGAGPGSFQIVYPQYQFLGVVAQHAHQLYLQFWLEYGIFGLIGCLWFLTWGWFKFRPGSDELGKTIRIIIGCFLVYGLMETWTVSPFLGGLFGMMVGIYLAQLREVQSGG